MEKMGQGPVMGDYTAHYYMQVACKLVQHFVLVVCKGQMFEVVNCREVLLHTFALNQSSVVVDQMTHMFVVVVYVADEVVELVYMVALCNIL